MTEQKSRDTNYSSDRKGVLLAIFRTVYGTPLARMIKFFTILGASCLVGSLTPEVVEKLGRNFAALFGSGNWADFIEAAVLFVVDFLNNSSTTVGWVLISMAFLLQFWSLFEGMDAATKVANQPRVSIRDGQAYFFNILLDESSFFTRLRFYFTTSLSDRLTAMNIPHSQDQRMKIIHYQKLRFSLENSKDAKVDKDAVSYLLKRILPKRPFSYLLGGSGMGKTTAIIKTYHDFVFNKHNRHYHCFLLHFREWPAKQQEWQKNGLDPKKIVLFLDGMDEDADIYDKDELTKRINLIKDKGYHRVLISCRVQFFESRNPGQKEVCLYLKGFSKTGTKQYLRKRFPLWKKRFPWFVKENRQNKKYILKLLTQNVDFAQRPMIIDWLCQWVKHADSQSVLKEKFSYHYQLTEAIIRQWYEREQLTLKKYGFDTSLKQIKNLMESLAVLFYLESGRGFSITQHELRKIFTEAGIKIEEGNFDRYCQQVQTHSLLTRNHLDYFSFAHHSILELIIARLLFTDMHPRLEFDKKIKKHQGILDFYNDMCWNEIVPSDFGSFSETEKSALKLYKKNTIFRLLNKKDGLNIGQNDVNRSGSAPWMIESFSNPAIRAFFLGMNKEQLQSLPWKDGQFACFEAMLLAWHENNTTGVSLEKEAALKRRFVQKIIDNQYENAFEDSIRELDFPLTVADYLSRPHCFFTEQADGTITFKHKCLLDYYIFGSGLSLNRSFINNYPRPYDFIIKGLAIREDVYIDEETLVFTKENQFFLLKFYPNKNDIKKLTVTDIKLTNVDPVIAYEHIKELYLSSNELEQAGSISRLSQLSILQLHNEINDLHALIGCCERERQDGRKELGLHLRHLKQLSLKNSNIKITHELLMTLAYQPYLKKLDLTGTKIASDFDDLIHTDNCLAALRRIVFEYPIPMVEVKGGEFIMGNTDGVEHVYVSWEKPAHRVTVAGFKLAKHTVSLGLFRRFIERTGYKTTAEQMGSSYVVDYETGEYVEQKAVCWQHNQEGKQEENEWMPVVHVSWYDAVHFCNWLSQEEGLDCYYEIDEIPGMANPSDEENTNKIEWQVKFISGANGYRLPTEAEWEYAAKDGNRQHNFSFAGSDNLDEVAWSIENAGNKPIKILNEKGEVSVADFKESRPHPHIVGQKIANYLGIYDMSGNVWEWCEDDWHDSYNNAPKNGSAWVDSPRASQRVHRGGGWGNGAGGCRVAYRNSWYPGHRDYGLGFRLAHSL